MSTSPDDRVTLRFLATPADTAAGGRSVAAGSVMEWIDKAGYACAVGWGGAYCVTAYVGNVRHRRPIPPGSLIEVRARIVHTGRTEHARRRHGLIRRGQHPRLHARDDLRADLRGEGCRRTADPRAAVDSGQHARTASSPRPRSSASTPAPRSSSLMLDEEYTAASTAPRTTLRFLVPTGVVNFGGQAHGGTVMRWIDEAAYACAVGWVGAEPLADHAIGVYSGGIHFLAPVRIGDLVEVDARIILTGPHSMHVSTRVSTADPRTPEQLTLTTQCLSVFVVPDDSGVALPVPQWQPELARGRAPARACARDRPPARDHRADRRFADARAVVPTPGGERRVCDRLCVMRISVRRANTRRSDRDRQDGSGCRGRRGRHLRRSDRDDGRLRPRRAAGRAHRRADRAGRGRPHDRGEQRRQRRHRPRRAAGRQAGAQDHLLLPAPARLLGLRRPVPRGRDRARDRAAGQPRRAHPRGGRRHRRVLLADRRGHRARRGQGGPHDRGPRLRARVPDPRRLRADQRAQGRPLGQPRVPRDRAQLRADHGVRRDHDDRAGRRDRAARIPRSRNRRDPRHLRRTASSRWASASGSRTASSSGESTSRAGPSKPPHRTEQPHEHPHQPRRARAAHRRRHPRGGVREPRHRRSDARRQLPARRPGDHPPHRERPARHGPGAGCRARRPRPHQRRQAGRDRAAGRRVLPPRRLVRR